MDKEQIKKESSRRIRQLIDEYCDGKQQDFADACGVSKFSISQYVNETSAPGNVSAAKIAKRYNLNPLWVMGFPVQRSVDAEMFDKVATQFNEQNSVFLKGRDRWHVDMYLKLGKAAKDQVDALTKALYDIQRREDALKASEPQLLAAHERTDVEMTPEEAERAKQHDLDLMRNKK